MTEIKGFKIKTFNVHGFDLKGKTEGKTNVVCVFCSHERKAANRNKKCATAYLDTGYYKCNHCGREGQLHEYHSIKDEPKYKRPTVRDFNGAYSDKLLSYLMDTRGLSKNSLERLKIRETKEWMPQTGKDQNCIAFDYWFRGDLINTKFRDGNKDFKLVKDAEKIFYNLDAVLTNDEIIIVEGEFDVVACYEAGVTNVISVPNGFNLKGNISLGYLDSYYSYFDGIEKIIIAVDNDEAGEKGKEELIRRFGADRCYTVDFKDCKDSNDYLVKYGKIALSEVFENCSPLPLENVETVMDYEDELDDFFVNGMPKGYMTGIANLDNYFSIEFGQYVVITGTPQSGKSELADAITLGYAINYGFKTAFCSAENKPNKFHSAKLIRKITGKTPNSKLDIDSTWYKRSKEFIDDHFFHLDYDNGYDLHKILKKFEELVKRKGVRVCVIDPYNKARIKGFKGNVNEYTAEYLEAIDRFCKKTQCIVILVAHPIKMQLEEGTKTYKMPTAYNIKGGGEVFDMSYHIIGMVKDVEKELVRLMTLKVKFQHLGSQNEEFWLKWNPLNGRYLSVNYHEETQETEIGDMNNEDYLSENFKGFFDNPMSDSHVSKEVIIEKLPTTSNELSDFEDPPF